MRPFRRNCARAWFAGAWAFTRVVYFVAEADVRQVRILGEEGLRRRYVRELPDEETGRVVRYVVFGEVPDPR